MQKLMLAGLVAGFFAAGAGLACDGDTGNTFILKNPDGTTTMTGSLDSLKSWKRALGNERRIVLYAIVDGEEFVITDPTTLAKARAIFDRDDEIDAKREALEKQEEALEAKLEADDRAAEEMSEALDAKQEALDDEEERISAQAERDLDKLVHEAIESGKATKPAKR